MPPRVPDGDPPEYDPDDAEAQRISEEYAEAAAEYDRAGEAWQETHYQPAPPDPHSGGPS
jgi:hypothetical protein